MAAEWLPCNTENPALEQDFFCLRENQCTNNSAPFPNAPLAQTTQVEAVAKVTVRAAKVMGKWRIMILLLQICGSSVAATMKTS
jgi:hypothetical protein